jgi:hypothetical protein
MLIRSYAYTLGIGIVKFFNMSSFKFPGRFMELVFTCLPWIFILFLQYTIETKSGLYLKEQTPSIRDHVSGQPFFARWIKSFSGVLLIGHSMHDPSQCRQHKCVTV